MLVLTYLSIQQSLHQFQRIGANAFSRCLFTKWHHCCSILLATILFPFPRGIPPCGLEHTIHIFSNFLCLFSTQTMPFTTGDDGWVRDTRPVTDLPPKDTQTSQLQKLLSNPALTSVLIIVM